MSKNIDYFDYIETRRKYDGLIADTNIMLLFIVGNYDLEYIKKFPFNRTACYSKEDFEILVNVFSHVKKIYITPHILTELSNLSRDVDNYKIVNYFNAFIKVLLHIKEESVEKNIILKSSNLYKFGVADFAIYHIARKKNYLVFTDDFKLSGFLKYKNIGVLNLKEIRMIMKQKKYN